MAELATVEDVLDYLGLEEDVNGLVDRALEAVEKRIRLICDRTSWLTGSYTDEFDGLESDAVILKHTPVDTAQTVTLSVRVSTDDADSVEVDSTAYRIEGASGILKLIETPTTLLAAGLLLAGDGLPCGFRNITCTYTGGYDADAIPADLADIAVRWAAARFRQRSRSDPALVAKRLGDASWQWNSDSSSIDADAGFRQELIECGYARVVV